MPNNYLYITVQKSLLFIHSYQLFIAKGYLGNNHKIYESKNRYKKCTVNTKRPHFTYNGATSNLYQARVIEDDLAVWGWGHLSPLYKHGGRTVNGIKVTIYTLTSVF